MHFYKYKELKRSYYCGLNEPESTGPASANTSPRGVCCEVVSFGSTPNLRKVTMKTTSSLSRSDYGLFFNDV